MTASTGTVEQGQEGHFRRRVGPWSATAINMTQMCGIGPFVTIPLMVATMGGPQAVFGWVIGAVLALADGLVWAELGAAMPGAGGTYLYLREAFQYRTGKLMPFLFAWTAVISIPLIMSTGVIGLVQYLGFFFPDMSWLEVHAIGLLVVAVVMVALLRRIESIRLLTTALWVVMIVTVVLVIAACYTHFDASLAFTFPQGAFRAGGPFFTGLGAGLLIAVYDYLGYNTTAYMGDELRDPGRSMPRSIIVSILAMMLVYLTLNVGVMGAVPWQEVASSSSVASLAVTRSWGHGAAALVTVLIIVTAFGSVFAGLLGGSRVPYNAARDRVFLPAFARLSPKGGYPSVALVFMGVVTAAGSLLDLTTVINMLTAVAVIVQSIAQVAALVVLRRRQPTLRRPYRMALYPLPAVVALVGWAYVYVSATPLSIGLSLLWIVAGVVAFLVWARVRRSWPFGPIEVREAYVELQEHGVDARDEDEHAEPPAVTA
ncbi:APC family permease [Lapillicoccus jejuensis]|uniref:Amino acid/polyamine/organocation transporter (APC superfamily) n=1 Tax=Lapillicoccus jejuensis TaxID=402171 RepID=A0A542E522_9MICO|nr:APC family permease [Lapillicoccus jejuensis]TQJ10376.1 amino acid/polyamine/organocation transporter (APC superfamily) [Lapillicoccus jejuensis]